MIVRTQPSPLRTMFRVSGPTLLLYLCVASISQTLWLNRNYTVFEGGGSDPQDYDHKPLVTTLADFAVSTFRDKVRTIESSKVLENEEALAPTTTSNSTTDSKQSTDSQPSTEELTSSSEEDILDQCVVSPFVKLNSTNHETSTREDDSAPSCAILFFGLPRSFKLFVLPSIIENIIVPNMDNNCDYYLHYHAVTSEGQSRGAAGGTIQGNDVFLLEDAIRQIYERDSTGSSIPHISITNSTIEEFEQARNQTMHRYETTLDENGEYLYFPYNAASWEYPHTMRNMVKQWHSIDAVWQHMEKNVRILKRNYSRVAMLRNDVMYVTPFDVYQLSTHERDVHNNHFVIPDWANYPINDRMVAGPYETVKIWATERFQRVESHVRTYPIPGWGMHSERFLDFSIFPAMLNASSQSSLSFSSGYAMDQNPNICFLRARADGSVWIEDCQESFDCDMEPVVFQLLAKYHNIANNNNDGGINCTTKSIEGIKYQDILTCRGDVTFSVL
jgi:hypothetical protein